MKVIYKGVEFRNVSKVNFDISNELGVCVFLQGETNTILECVEIGKLKIAD